VAIVTGAGSGVGRAVCVPLAAKGWRIALIGRTESTLQETASILRLGTRAMVIVADLANAESPRMIADRTIQAFGRIDAVVNNAAILITAPIEAADGSVMQQTFATNTIGPALLVSAVWPTFVKQRGGCVVNVSSMSAIDPFAGLGVYGASKVALEGFARAYANEGKKHGIRAFAVSPGAVETAMLRGMFSESKLPRSKTLLPETVAKVIVACILGERDNENGKTIVMPSPI